MALVANMKKTEKSANIVVLEQNYTFSTTISPSLSFDLSSYDLTGKTVSDFTLAYKSIVDRLASSENVFQLENATLSGSTLTVQPTASGGGQTSSAVVYCIFAE